MALSASGLDLHEPLRRDAAARRSSCSGRTCRAAARSLSMPTRKPPRFEVCDNALARLEAVEAGVRAGVRRSSARLRSSPRSAAGCGAARPRSRWDRARASPSPRRCRTRGWRDVVEDDRDLAIHQRQHARSCRADRGSARRSELTATAVSPSMVSGRVVATMMYSSGIPINGIADVPQLALASPRARLRDRRWR